MMAMEATAAMGATRMNESLAYAIVAKLYIGNLT
jgi:hypothetical protein